MLSTLDFIQILLLVFACYCCYLAGKLNGAVNLASRLIDANIITFEQLEKIKDNE